jgi:hypothetical protein
VTTYKHTKTTWSDGNALTASNSANRWESSLELVTNDTDTLDDRVASLETILVNTTQGGGGPAVTGYRYGTTAEAGPPTAGGSLFYNTTTSELWIPGGSGWYKTALTAVSGVSGGSNAPTNFTADVQSDSSINLAWTLPTPPGGNTITGVTVREKFKSPTGVSGMPLAGSATTNTRSASLTPSTREYYVTCSFSGGTESAESNHVTVTLPYGSTTGTTGGGTSTGTGTPATVLNIGSGATQNHFSVDVGNAGGANVSHSMAEIVAGFVQDGYFGLNNAGDAVYGQCYANSGTTSGSPHPRTELRETKADGTKAAWTCASGRTHDMFGTSTVTHLPADAESSSTPKPQVCFAQIHDTDNIPTGYKGGDVVRLQVENSGSTPSDSPGGNSVANLHIVAHTHSPNGASATETKTSIASSYTIGTAINWRIRVVDTTCSIYLGGTITGTPGNYTYSGGSVVKSFTISGDGFYYKALDYQQFSTVSGDGQYKSTSYATVELKNLQVTHSPAL